MGRERELAQADEALQAALGGDVQVVLIGGDAGIGKTSLVDAVLDLAAARGFLTLEGHCLDTDTGIPLAPALEALRPLVAEQARSADRPVAGRISASTTPGVDDLRQLVAESVHHGPTLIAIEDMHWSDPSTRDLCLAMARAVRGALVIALTWRADDVTRRHPLRRVLVDLARAAGARRIDLGPLDRSDIARIVEFATGAAPDPSLVGALLARSEGNPLYVEELLAAKPDTVPGLLSDLLLAHVDALPGPTRELLRIAAVGGSRIDTDLLAAVSGLEPLTLESRLREAIDANVILRHGDSLDFRHGLLREAVYDDLLPGERTRLHGAYAGAMQARLDSGAMPPLMAPLGQLAFHWYAAHALPSTLAVSVRAGLVAKQFGAIEARTHLERALSLWDRVPDAEQVAGQAKPDVLRSLAEVVGEAGDADRPRALLREAAALLRPDGDPLLASRVYSTIAAQCYEYDDVIGQAEALDRALRYAQASPSPELSKALWTKGGYHWRHHQFEAALGASTSAIEVALAVGDLEGERRGRLVRGESLMLLGRTTEALEEIDRAGRLSERVDAISEVVWTQVLTAWMTWDRGDPEPGPLALIRRTRASAERHEFGWLVCDCAEFEVPQLIGEGRLADADLLLHELEEIELPRMALGQSEERGPARTGRDRRRACPRARDRGHVDRPTVDPERRRSRAPGRAPGSRRRRDGMPSDGPRPPHGDRALRQPLGPRRRRAAGLHGSRGRPARTDPGPLRRPRSQIEPRPRNGAPRPHR